MNKITLDSIAENHFFFYIQAGKELQAMMAHAFDLDSDNFDKAQQRFDLARSRAREEFKKFMEYSETLDMHNEETGDTL
jgi:hypothetical protein